MTNPSSSALASFKFDENLAADENITAFLAALKHDEPELAALFEGHLDLLRPLPLEPQRRASARARFNAEITKALDASGLP